MKKKEEEEERTWELCSAAVRLERISEKNGLDFSWGRQIESHHKNAVEPNFRLKKKESQGRYAQKNCCTEMVESAMWRKKRLCLIANNGNGCGSWELSLCVCIFLIILWGFFFFLSSKFKLRVSAFN